MLYHGWLKLANLKGASKIFKKMGFNPPMFWASLFGINELFGGIFVIIGFYSELFAVLFGFEMLITTLWQIMAKESFHSCSYGLQSIFLSLILIMFGPGVYAAASFDAKFFLELPILILLIAIAAILAYQNQPVSKNIQNSEGE